MANFSEAYDFALFEERTAAAPAVVEQPQRQPRRGPQRSPRENVVELPKHEAEKRARPKRRPFRFLAGWGEGALRSQPEVSVSGG